MSARNLSALSGGLAEGLPWPTAQEIEQACAEHDVTVGEAREMLKTIRVRTLDDIARSFEERAKSCRLHAASWDIDTMHGAYTADLWTAEGKVWDEAAQLLRRTIIVRERS